MTLATALSPGEYCFFHPGGMSGPSGAGGKVFDFGVSPQTTAGSSKSKLQEFASR